MKLGITSAFDAGNIEVINTDSYKNIQLKIRKDTESDFLQCFYFRMQEAKGQACNLNLINAGEAAYPEEKTLGNRAATSRGISGKHITQHC